MEKRKLLIATTNEGKFEEIKHFLGDLPFWLVSIKDCKEPILEPEETEETLEGNAIAKARYYGERTGLLSLADDTGLFIDALGGWPGVKSARVAETNKERVALTLKKLEGQSNRRADFRAVMAVYDPDGKEFFTALGETSGEILLAPVERPIGGHSYDPIFFIPEAGKTFAEMTVAEKNATSHRGKALIKIKYFLQNQYRGKHVVVPLALIVRDGKILASLRNDPHRPDYHKKWEFPGGAVELGADIPETLVREVEEETGLEVRILKILQGIKVRWLPEFAYQVYLLPYVCRITGGKEEPNDAEVLEIRWFDLEEFRHVPMIGDNDALYEAILPELKEVMAKL